MQLTRKILRPDDVCCIGGLVSHVCHDGDEHVLLLAELSRVEADSGSKERDAPVRQCQFPSLRNGIAKQLRNVGPHGDVRLPDREELVNKAENDRKGNTNNPGSDGGARYRRVVVVVDDGTDLGVGAVGRDEGCFDLHLVNEVFVFLRMLKDVLVP